MNLMADIWSVLTPRQRRRVAFAQLISVVMALSTVTGIASIAPFFAVLGNPQSIEHNKYLHWLYVHSGLLDQHSFGVWLGLGFMSLVFFSNLISITGSFAIVRLASSIGAELQSCLFAEYLARPYVFHARTHSAVLFNNIIHEAARATNGVLQNIFTVITNLATGSLIILAVILLNPLIASGMIVALAGGYVLIYLAVRSRLVRAGQIQSHHFTVQTRVVAESLGAIKEIQILRIQDFFRAAFQRSSLTYARSVANTYLIAQSPRYAMECVAVVGLVVVALIGTSRVSGIGPWLGQLTFLGFAAYRLLPILQQAFAAIVRIRASGAGFGVILPHLSAARGRRDAPADIEPFWRDRPQRAIEIKGVSFRYVKDRTPAIDNLSIRIPARSAIGFIGTNGSGKTTTVDLVAGLLVPDSGQVTIDGMVLDDSNRGAWQSQIAYVPQNVFLLDTSIAENIALGVPMNEIDKKRLYQAARLAQLDEFVDTLPGKYEHRVGERGANLSGGERQRIGIARALYTTASVLVMDEATNALDGLTEQELMGTIMRLRGSYTIILIAHRISTVRACDLICELNRGRISSLGSYDELLRSSESFKQLVEYQSAANV